MNLSRKMLRGLGCGILAFAMSAGQVGLVSVSAAQGTVITVGKGSGYDYNTVSEALASVSYTPTKRNPLTINIAKGTYEESFTVSIPYVTLIHD
ncbi:MAG: hypothetical protein LUH47_11095, partial [Clostridiales bacterium]|nr:hypothetical protein [Clostridiales bacterium]